MNSVIYNIRTISYSGSSLCVRATFSVGFGNPTRAAGAGSGFAVGAGEKAEGFARQFIKFQTHKFSMIGSRGLKIMALLI